MFEKDLMDMEAVWLIVTYVEYVWTEKFLRNKHVKLEQLVGHTKLCYKSNQFSKKPALGHISYIS